MKTSNRRKFASLVLIFAMVVSIYVPGVAKAENTVPMYMKCTVRVAAPYDEYYNSYDVTLRHDGDEDDLADDFGIGLPTDMSDAKLNEETGVMQYYTAARALAKAIRDFIMFKTGIEDKAEANKLMKNYIDVSTSQYGLSLNGLSAYGEKWNDGAFKDSTVGGTIFVDGYWAFLADGMYSDNGISGTYVDTYTDLEFLWVPISGFTGYGTVNFENSGIQLVGKDITGTVERKVFDYDESGKVSDTRFEPVVGARVEIRGADGEGVLTEAVTDANGQFKVNQSEAGEYKIMVYDEATNEAGQTYSKMSNTVGWVSFREKPKAPTNVKVKAKKSKAKKKTITVTWKKVDDWNATYQVYVSKKKKSGYKKVKQIADKNKVTFKRAKGTYYVKVRNANLHEYGEDEDYHVVGFYSSFTKPVKIKVK
ncbi:MAG TPA: hypothetical protein DCP06_01450 [Lachnospiraceae bacterium]|nr:hypothetical protein [Lachnospiraceae bacterium]